MKTLPPLAPTLAAALALAFLIAPLSAVAQSHNPEDVKRNAVSFVENIGDEILEILYNPSLSQNQRAQQLKTSLIKKVALSKLASFMLGPYARKMSKEQRNKYVKILPDYAAAAYFSRIGVIPPGVSHSVLSARIRDKKARHVIVNSSLVLPSENPNRPPIPLQWWILRNSKGDMRIFDLSAAGIWFGQEQRASFVSLIKNNNGDPQIIIDVLKKAVNENKIPS